MRTVFPNWKVDLTKCLQISPCTISLFWMASHLHIGKRLQTFCKCSVTHFTGFHFHCCLYKVYGRKLILNRLYTRKQILDYGQNNSTWFWRSSSSLGARIWWRQKACRCRKASPSSHSLKTSAPGRIVSLFHATVKDFLRSPAIQDRLALWQGTRQEISEPFMSACKCYLFWIRALPLSFVEGMSKEASYALVAGA